MAPSSRPAMTVRASMTSMLLEAHRLARKAAEQGQGGERRRADGEALADGGGGVADGVELVGALRAPPAPSSAISAMPPALSAMGP